MAWALFSPAFWISPGVTSTRLISPSKSLGKSLPGSTHTGRHRGRLAGRSGSCSFVAAQRKDWRRGVRHRVLDVLRHFGWLGTMPEFMRLAGDSTSY